MVSDLLTSCLESNSGRCRVAINVTRRLAVSAALLISFAVHGQTPTFRTETTLVQLPVRVVDASGAFVRGLAAEDFEVSEDGVRQTISDFSFVDLSVAARRDAGAQKPGALSIPELEQVEGRLFVFLLDDAHTDVMHSARARDLLRGFIRDRMVPGDAAAVVIASGAARQDFTYEKPPLLKAVDRFTGTLNAGEPAAVRLAQARAVVRLFSDLAGALGRIRGRQKSVIYVGTQIGCQVAYAATTDFAPTLNGQSDSPSGDRDANMSAAGAGAAPDAGTQLLCHEELWDGVRAAVQANVSLYAIDPRGMQNRGWISPTVDGRGGPDMARRRMQATEPGRINILDGFHVLSDHSGGFAVTGTNNFRDAFDRIAREISTYYLLSYTSTNTKADGRYRRTLVKVRRPDAQTFHRPGYLAHR